MSWKRSKDGGMDFDVAKEMEHREIAKRYNNAKKNLFNHFMGSASTVTNSVGDYPEVPNPTPRESIAQIRRRQKRKNYGSYGN